MRRGGGVRRVGRLLSRSELGASVVGLGLVGRDGVRMAYRGPSKRRDIHCLLVVKLRCK